MVCLRLTPLPESPMLSAVPTTARSLDAHRPLIGEDPMEEIRRLAAPLRGARVLHVNATAFGGGVAEILSTIVPLMNDVGIHAEWQVIRGADEFFNVTKAMHNSLQGMLLNWTPQMREIWLRYNEMNAKLIEEEYDFVIIHDPQPAAMLGLRTKLEGRCPSGKWVWRCHIDLTEAQVEVWEKYK